MKTFRYLVFLLILGATACTGGPRVYEYDPANPYIDLGMIKEIDGPVSFDIKINNDSDGTMIPLRTATECSCTRLDVYYEPVEAGSSIIIHASYDPAYRKGPQEEKGALYFKDAGPAVFTILADVKPFNHIITEDHPYAYGNDLYLSHKLLPYGSMEPGETKDMFFRIGNGSTRKARIDLVPENGYSDALRFRQPGKVAADWRDTIHVKFTMPETKTAGDTIRFNIQPRVNGNATELALGVFAVCR